MRLELTFEATVPLRPEGAPCCSNDLAPGPATAALGSIVRLSGRSKTECCSVQDPLPSSSSIRPRSPVQTGSALPRAVAPDSDSQNDHFPERRDPSPERRAGLEQPAGAPASLYLNFLGDSTPSYGSYSNIITPAYDQDGDPTTFSDGELAAIQKIWSYVAEDYAPFNINVTTVPPANMAHGVTEKVDIGGDGAWTGGKSGGLCYVNDFTVAGIPNIAFVFSQNLAGGNATVHRRRSFARVGARLWIEPSEPVFGHDPGPGVQHGPRRRHGPSHGQQLRRPAQPLVVRTVRCLVHDLPGRHGRHLPPDQWLRLPR